MAKTKADLFIENAQLQRENEQLMQHIEALEAVRAIQAKSITATELEREAYTVGYETGQAHLAQGFDTLRVAEGNYRACIAFIQGTIRGSNGRLDCATSQQFAEDILTVVGHVEATLIELRRSYDLSDDYKFPHDFTYERDLQQALIDNDRDRLLKLVDKVTAIQERKPLLEELHSRDRRAEQQTIEMCEEIANTVKYKSCSIRAACREVAPRYNVQPESTESIFHRRKKH